MRDLNTFFKLISEKGKSGKWKYYRDEKQDFERFLIFLNIEKKSKKLEFKIEFKLNEEFVAM